MRAIQISDFGSPSQTLRFTETDEPPPPAPGEASIGMEFAPINFNDFLLIRGTFPFRPALPAVAGNEGVGRVLAVGAGVDHVVVGDRVAPPLYSGTWRERLVVPATDLFALPAADPRQLSMLRINPPTAALLLSEFADLEPGDWVIQNAANSGVGRSVIAFAKARGLNTVNLVRRPELVAEIEAIGGDVVLLDEPGALDGIGGKVGSKRFVLALDGLAGDATARIAAPLTRGGGLVGYSFMSGDRTAPGDLRSLMMREIHLHSFYQGKAEYEPKIAGLLRQGADLIASGAIHAPVAAAYPLSKIGDAVAHAERGGKVLLDIEAAG